jgi:hypothetical protein
MPDQGVAAHAHAVRFRKLDRAIGLGEVEYARLRLDRFPLHLVLVRHGAELAHGARILDVAQATGLDRDPEHALHGLSHHAQGHARIPVRRGARAIPVASRGDARGFWSRARVVGTSGQGQAQQAKGSKCGESWHWGLRGSSTVWNRFQPASITSRGLPANTRAAPAVNSRVSAAGCGRYFRSGRM